MTPAVLNRTTISAADDKSNVESEIFDTQGNGTGKIEVFKNECVRLMKAIKFNQWAQAEWTEK